MKLRFYPVLWCLLTVIFLSPTSSEATSKVTAYKAKTSENKDLTINQSTTFLTSSHLLATTNTSAISGTTKRLNPLVSESKELAENASVKENSYKNSKFSSANSEKISINLRSSS